MAVKLEPWLLLEIGGSSAQTARRDASGRFWFTPGLVRVRGRATALACPGVVRAGRVLYATSLGWPDDANPGEELDIDHLLLVVNDASAAALGEAVLRGRGTPHQDLVYISLGTGVGSARVVGGAASELNVGHAPIGGSGYCEGCRATGCLNSELSSARLPDWLAPADQDRVARTLVPALLGAALGDEALIVLGGGIARRHPDLATAVGRLLPNPVETTAAPFEAKSAAFAGLDYLSRSHTTP